MGWSQAELADRLAEQLGSNVSTKAVGAWETDMNKPAALVDVANGLKEITGIPAGWFLGLDDVEQ